MKARLFLLALLLATAAQAQTYRWVDKEGKVHYGDRPPATAAGQVQERRLGAPAADKTLPYNVQQAVANFPVTLYVTADCSEGCKDGRDYLKARGIPFSEKSVATNEEIDALKSLVGGGEESLARVTGEFRAEFLGTGEGPLGIARRVRAESRRVAGAAHVADDELLVRIAKIKLGLEAAVVKIAFRQAVAEEHEILADGRRGDRLRARYGGGGWLVVGGVTLGIRVFF